MIEDGNVFILVGITVAWFLLQWSCDPVGLGPGCIRKGIVCKINLPCEFAPCSGPCREGVAEGKKEGFMYLFWLMFLCPHAQMCVRRCPAIQPAEFILVSRLLGETQRTISRLKLPGPER